MTWKGAGAWLIDTAPRRRSLVIRSEHRAEPVAPEPRSLVAHVDAPLSQQIFHIPARKENLTHIITTSRITSGEDGNQRNGLCALFARQSYPSQVGGGQNLR
jgi:hypothetical protein